MPSPYSQYKKPELLSPAGNMECFFAAIENGADAVYFGLEDFSARAGAQNFTLDDASKSITYAHKKSVKVYIALNTLIKTRELERGVDLLIALEELQPDALILQDLGLLYLIQSQFPRFNLHASTQMTIHNLAGVRQLEKMGFKRVVLARELSVDEIRNISGNTSIETEVFVHGALCYSYSGLCFFSSMIGGRSGNRGRCAQPCRMYYKSPSGEGGHLFSMKDLLTLSRLNDLMAMGVHSFKIEGRMKSPEYVAVVTNMYRQAIDGKLQDRGEAIRRIKTVFSRETTQAYLFQETSLKNKKNSKSAQYQTENNFSSPPCERGTWKVFDFTTPLSPSCEEGERGEVINSPESPFDIGQLPNHGQVKPADMINPLYPANIGSYAGEVIRSEKGYVVIRADADIGVRDLLQVFENIRRKPALLYVEGMKVNGRKVFGIKAGEIAAINAEQQFNPGARIHIISSQKINEAFASKIPKKLIPCKAPVDLEVKIRADGVSIRGTVRQISFNKEYPVKLERGMNRVIGTGQIRDVFSRLGETPFELAGIHAEVSEKLFMPLSILNDIRRDYFQNLLEAWQKEREQRSQEIKQWVKKRCIDNNLAQHSRNQMIPLFPPFVREKGSDMNYPPLIPPLAGGGTGGCKKTFQEKKFLQGNTPDGNGGGLDDIFHDGIRLSLKIDKLNYLNNIPLEKVYKIYIALSNEILTVPGLTKKTETTTLLSPPYEGGDKEGVNQKPLPHSLCEGRVKNLSPDEIATHSMRENEVINTLSKFKDKVVFSLPAIMRDTGNVFGAYGYFKKTVQALIAQNFQKFQISNPGAMGLFEGEDVQLYADYPLYCLNPLSAMKLRELGFTRYTLSPEDGKENLQTLFSEDADVIIYQDIPLFTSETCIWANMKRICTGISRCGFMQMIVENEYGDRFTAMNERCKTVVIGEKPFSITHLIPKLLDAGQTNFRIDLCYRNYTPEMIKDIFLSFQNKSKIKDSMIGNFERGLS
ncbi:MAG: U32 family peptidase [Candidatus Brocadia sinica]|nr:U32 family peptidase [Candidatus Brocadia sinica]